MIKTRLINGKPGPSYTSAFLAENHDMCKDWVLVDEYLANYINPSWVNNEWIEAATPEEVKENLKHEIKAKYELHRFNGWNAYQNFRAIIVSDIYDAKINEPQAFIIEQFLKVAYDRISQNGDWKTARHELGQITGYPSFVNEYYDLALQFIDDYINNNYDS